MLKKVLEFLLHIQEECNYIVTNSENIFESDFLNDQTIKRAFVRSLEIIGEASKNIDRDYKQKHREIAWKKMTEMF